MAAGIRPVLDDVPVSDAFWTCSGVLLHNLRELVTYLGGCNEHDYAYHVNTDLDKNDFAVWIRDVIHDEVLARNLSNALPKDQYLARVNERLADLLRWDRDDQVRRLAST